MIGAAVTCVSMLAFAGTLMAVAYDKCSFDTGDTLWRRCLLLYCVGLILMVAL